MSIESSEKRLAKLKEEINSINSDLNAYGQASSNAPLMLRR